MPKSEQGSKKYNLRGENRKRNKYYEEEEEEDHSLDIKRDKWSIKEVVDLTEGILTHGHLSPKILDNLPYKSWNSYFKFFTQSCGYARAKYARPPSEFIYNLNNWITKVKSNDEGFRSPLDIAMLLKLLSMDGVLENHPTPEMANGVDFGACYRLLFQAVLGYPLQPLNEPTLKLFSEVFTDVAKSTENDREGFEKIANFLHGPGDKTDMSHMFSLELPKKQVKSYSRKKPSPSTSSATNSEDADVLKKVLEDPSYNPFKFPRDLLTKSFHSEPKNS